MQPLHVAAYIEQLGRERSAPTVKQRLAAIRHLFDWLVTGQVIPVNPASSVRGPSHSVKRGKTPVLDPSEACALLDSIDIAKPVGLRDRALIGLMVYSFARIGAALSMKVEDVYVQNRRLKVALRLGIRLVFGVTAPARRPHCAPVALEEHSIDRRLVGKPSCRASPRAGDAPIPAQTGEKI